jgi:hypothetical protein
MPKSKQIRKGVYKHKEQHCRNSNAVDHNVRRCLNAPAINRRQQRARGRDLSISDSDLESFSSSDSSDFKGSNELEDSEQRQFQREMEQYDEIMARLQKVAENDSQRQELELDCNSELSVLASSLFNRMEGLERDSSTVVGQDNQHMEGVEIRESSQVGSSEVQGLVFSPRKTRSGCVLQRKGDK